MKNGGLQSCHTDEIPQDDYHIMLNAAKHLSAILMNQLAEEQHYAL